MTVSQLPIDGVPLDDWYADVYRFNKALLKWERQTVLASKVSNFSDSVDTSSLRPFPIVSHPNSNA